MPALRKMKCETPKSPPGDYNAGRSGDRLESIAPACVKHLNPRQGITKQNIQFHFRPRSTTCVKHLNPRQGITTLECRPLPLLHTKKV